ncbi:hypothetical protein Gpo141_00010341 [Globisporangium polare]
MHDGNEDHTSQLCNCCHGKVIPMCTARAGAWRFTECDASPATYMRKTMNRDVNAALNSLDLGTAETLHSV